MTMLSDRCFTRSVYPEFQIIKGLCTRFVQGIILSVSGIYRINTKTTSHITSHNGTFVAVSEPTPNQDATAEFEMTHPGMLGAEAPQPEPSPPPTHLAFLHSWWWVAALAAAVAAVGLIEWWRHRRK